MQCSAGRRTRRPVRAAGVALAAALLALPACRSGPPKGGDPVDAGKADSPPVVKTNPNVDTTAPGPPPPGGDAVPTKLEPIELRDAMRNFADMYRSVVAEVCDSIVRESDDPAVRRRAQATKIQAATAMYDIVIDPVPATALLNGLTLVSLQVNTLENRGDAYFGGMTQRLLQKAEYLEEEAYRLAARVMSNDQRRDLWQMCQQWSKDHPEQVNIWYVRLDDLPGIKRGASVIDVVDGLTNLPAAFMSKLNPFAAAQDAASDASVLAERMSWLAPRLMVLAQWRAEAVIYDTLATTEITGTLDMAERLTQVAETLPGTITEQREALFNDLKENEGTISTLLRDTQAITGDAVTLVNEGDEAIGSTTELMKEIDGIVARVQAMQAVAAVQADSAPKPPAATQPSKPFDINEYTETVRALNDVVNDTNELVKTTNSSLTSESIDDKLDPIRDTIASLIWLAGGVVVGGALIIILAVKLIPRRRHYVEEV